MSHVRSTATRRLAADDAGIEAAAALIASGAVVAFPTETVYGLGADATDPAAVAAIYAAKGRPRFNPLIAHLPNFAEAAREGVLDARARELAERFWPGPLTLVVPAAPNCRVCDVARAGLATVALRVPAHPIALALMRRVGRPVAAPSANRSGRVSPTSAGHVAADLEGRIAAILDGGAASLGLESTIVACLPEQPVRLLRPGGLPRELIEAVLGGHLVTEDGDDAILAPGGLASHYAPNAPLRLDATRVGDGEAGLMFGRSSLFAGAGAGPILDLSPDRNFGEAATNLFAALRYLDAAQPSAIAVAVIPGNGLGEAIRDRLRRGAAPRGVNTPGV